jgi:hypothetical protein
MQLLNYQFRTGVTSIFEGSEEVFNYAVGYYSIPELHKFVHLKAMQLLESGLFSFLQGKAKVFKPEVIGPQVLSMFHLTPGFVIFCVFLALSVVAFLIEVTPKVSREIFNWCLPCYVVVKFVRMNKML